MDLKQIGYFLYMEEQEKKQKQLKVNADIEADLVGAEATTSKEEDLKKFFPVIQPVPYRILDKVVDARLAAAAALNNTSSCIVKTRNKLCRGLFCVPEH